MNITLNIILNPVHFSSHKINIIKESNLINKTVTDPGFSRRGRGGAKPWIWGKSLLFGKIFAENCMEIKEIGPGEGCTSLGTPPLDPPMQKQPSSNKLWVNQYNYTYKIILLP